MAHLALEALSCLLEVAQLAIVVRHTLGQEQQNVGLDFTSKNLWGCLWDKQQLLGLSHELFSDHSPRGSSREASPVQ